MIGPQLYARLGNFSVAGRTRNSGKAQALQMANKKCIPGPPEWRMRHEEIFFFCSQTLAVRCGEGVTGLFAHGLKVKLGFFFFFLQVNCLWANSLVTVGRTWNQTPSYS